MRDDPNPPSRFHVLDDVSWIAAERIRRRGHVQRQVVPALGANLHGVQAKNTRTVDGRIRVVVASPWSVKHHELESSSRGRRRHLRGRANDRRIGWCGRE